jgi:hypothetical protein
MARTLYLILSCLAALALIFAFASTQGFAGDNNSKKQGTHMNRDDLSHGYIATHEPSHASKKRKGLATKKHSQPIIGTPAVQLHHYSNP